MNVEEFLKKLEFSSIRQKGWLPLVLITATTVLALIASIISLILGWQTIFQNLFYFPIILACVYYVKRGFIFSLVLASLYFILMAVFSQDPVVLTGALVRVAIFILVAAVITYLSQVRIRVEDALKESEEFNRGLVENMPDLVLVYDPEWKVEYVNPMAFSMLGYSSSEMVGTDIRKFAVPTQQGDIIGVSGDGFTKTRPGSLEIGFITKSGQQLTAISRVSYLKFRNRPALLMLLADITERKRAEDALRESEARYRNLFENMLEGFAYHRIVYDQKGVPSDFIYLEVNSAFNRLIGKQDVKGKLFTELFPGTRETYPEIFEICGRVVSSGMPESFNLDFSLLNRIFHISIYSPAKEHFVMIFEDITERVLLEQEMKYHEEELRQFSSALRIANKKLTLLSGITRHDINNQLTVLIGYLDLLEMKATDPAFKHYFTSISGAAERIQKMIQFTKEYEGIGVHAPVWQDARTLVETATNDVALGKIRVLNEIPAGTSLYADPLIVKVCFNLMENAVRYGEKITRIRFSTKRYNGDLMIVCEDDGNGIAEGEKEKIFDRGFGKNTGLGLFLSREILAITGITIRETGNAGEGAWFEIIVPPGAWRDTGSSDS